MPTTERQLFQDTLPRTDPPERLWPALAGYLARKQAETSGLCVVTLHTLAELTGHSLHGLVSELIEGQAAAAGLALALGTGEAQLLVYHRRQRDRDGRDPHLLLSALLLDGRLGNHSLVHCLSLPRDEHRGTDLDLDKMERLAQATPPDQATTQVVPRPATGTAGVRDLIRRLNESASCIETTAAETGLLYLRELPRPMRVAQDLRAAARTLAVLVDGVEASA